MEIFNHTDLQIDDLLKTGVYKIYHISNPNLVYIGSASRHISLRKCDLGFIVRWKRHLTELKNNKHPNNKLQRVVNKYGIEGLRFDIVEFCDSKDCIKREIYYSELYDSFNNGYNLRLRADSFIGRTHSEETKKKIKEGNIGKKLLQSTRDKISKARKGKSLSIEHIKKVKEGCNTNKYRFCYNREGKLVYTFSSGRECEKFFNIRKGHLWGYIKNLSHINKEFLVFNKLKTEEEVQDIIKSAKLELSQRVEKMNNARLSKRIPC